MTLKDKYASVRWGGLARFEAERKGNYTQASIERENFAGAKARGGHIERMRGGRQPTERFVNGEWVKLRDV